MMNSMRYLTGFLLLLLVLTGCEDRGYGTQDISTVPSVTSTDKVTIVDSIPKQNAKIASRSYINVAFSSYMDANSVSVSNVKLTDNNGTGIGIEVKAVQSYLYIRPETSLTPDHNYTLEMDSNIKDIFGNPLDKSYRLTFLCSSDFWESVDAGETHSMARSQDGDLYIWGGNSRLQLIEKEDELYVDIPLPLPNTNSSKTYSAGSFSSVLINSDGHLVSGGINALSDYNEQGFISVSVGGNHVATLKDDGTLFSWGSNSNGQLGNLGTQDRNEPVQEYYKDTNWTDVSAGGDFTLALKKDGTLWGWGDNQFGQLGLKLLNTIPLPVKEDTNATNWLKISAGSNHSTAIKKDNTLWSWGHNDDGQLGHGDIELRRTATQVGSDMNWSTVSAGFNHTVAIKTDGSLWTWGANGWGQLGDGSTTESYTPLQEDTNSTLWTDVSAGKQFTLAVKFDGTLWAWGSNWNRQLGLGEGIPAKYLPTEVK